MSFISAGNTTTTTLLINGDTTGNLVFNTGGANTTALTIDNTQAATFAGNLTFSGTAVRITGDFSNATQSNRVLVQSSTANGSTVFGLIPNGTATTAVFRAYGNATPTNTSTAELYALSTEARIASGAAGTGTYLPLTFYTNNAEAMRIDTSGNLAIGTTSQTGKLTVVNAGDAISAKTLSNNNYSAFIGYNLSGTATFFVSGAGAVTKASGTFKIEHPLPEKAATHDLVHSFIEGPNADLIYRGKVALVNGKATVNIDTEARMTEGTFVLLCRNVQCFTTNESDWTAVRGSVSGNLLTIEAQDNTSTANISWMVIGERQDKHMYDTDWTDDNGRPIIEPLKKVEAQAAEIAALKAAK